ncbi:BPTI/Kunitz domain-containing protein-like isoform X2 [Carettochelys insculpta]|uniref:BPTI/Kunitz domain-containing protein-like isoform X2 n=1 Tax=Carettochelys insculpta TaxID=44489 RepID=UPI003EBDD692
MKSGLLLLALLLTLWAELPPASGQQLPAGEICKLPAETGPCKAFFPHYFYNSLTRRCEIFIYGGCGGNENRFATEEECRRTCGQPVTEICKLPMDSGPCFGYMLSYFYNSVTQRCERFVYGGCGGNENRFTTEAECRRTCGQPAKPGFCPVIPPDTWGICGLMCFSDNDCLGAKKCCNVGCGQICLMPSRAYRRETMNG